MDQITNSENASDPRRPYGSLVPGESTQVAEPYRRDNHVYPYYGPQIETERGLDVFRYLRVITKYRWLIIGTTICALILATVITLMMTPIYTAAASLQIDREVMNVVGVGTIQMPEEKGSSLEFYQTQYELLASRSLAERVATTLGLVDDERFQKNTRPSLRSFITNLFQRTQSNETKPALENRLRQTVSRVRGSLTILPVRASRIVRITVSLPNREMAQKIANGYIDAFVAASLDRRYEASAYARKFLEERLQQLKVRLEESEKQLVKYAEEKGIITLAENRSLVDADLEAINAKLTELRNERIKQELLWKQAQITDGLSLKEVRDSATVQENRKLHTQLIAEYQQKLALYRPAYPAMVQLRKQIEELDHQLELEIKAVKIVMKTAYEGAQKAEELLTQQLEAAKAIMVEQRNRSIQYNILQREVDTNRTLYDGLLQRYKEIGIAGNVGANNVSVVDRASLPVRPSSPRLTFNIALALLLGLGSGILAAFGLDYLDDSFKVPEDIERETGLSVIGVVPLPKLGRLVEEEVADPHSGMAEAYRSLRTGLQFASSEGLPKSLLVTSSRPSEGKSTTTLCLARSFASIGLNVLLVDADLRNAKLHKQLHCNNQFGLSNYLTGAMLAEQVVQETDQDTLAFMASGPLPPNPAELLSGSRFMSLLTLAGQAFDIVIIDAPPVMGLADAPLLSTAAQATLLVVAANETRRSTFKVAIKRLQLARANLLGAMLNKFNSRQPGYGYGYGYGEYDYHTYGTKQLPAAEG
jgi:polysaccharide biosynthesis transport protein